MNYRLKLLPIELKDWRKIGKETQSHFKKHLEKRLKNPHIAKARLKGDLKGCYKIKLHSIGYRLVYQVIDKELVIIVIAVGKRDKLQIYSKANERGSN